MRNFLIFFTVILLAATSCQRFGSDGYLFDNILYIDVSATNELQPASFGNNIPEFTKDLAVNLVYPSDSDVKAVISVDESYVDEYNRKNGTSLTLLPQQYIDFTGATVTIPEGKTVSETVTLTFSGLMGEGDDQVGALDIDRTYLFPLRITSDDMPVMSGSSVACYLVCRSSGITMAAQLTDNWINFPLMDEPGPVAETYNGLTAVTYEALIYIDKFDSENSFGECNISSVMGVEQYLLLRIGDASFERQQLQFDGSGDGTAFGKFPEADPSKKLETGRWYHVACTYDYDTRIVRVYVDGKIQSEGKEMGTATGGINLALRAIEEVPAGQDKKSYQFFIGKSYNDYRPLQGKIAEARVWSVARTPEQIWDNMYRIENPETLPELIGYWKFNEGKGNTVRDYSAYGNDGVAEYDIIWPEGIEITEINKEED